MASPKVARALLFTAGLAILGVMGAAGFWWAAMRNAPAPPGAAQAPGVSSSIGAMGVSPKKAAPPEQGPYVPTSVYAEPGADSDVTQLSMKGDEGPRGATPLMRNEIDAAMRAHQDELLACYAEGLADDPEMAGRVHFHLRVARDGHVALVRVTRSELRSKRIEDCFVRKARAWKFRPTEQQALAKFDTFFDFRT